MSESKNEIMYVCGIHTNTCDPILRYQYVVARTKAGEYKKYTDSALQKVMHQMIIDQEINVKTMIALLKKYLPSKKSIDRHMINNVRLRALKARNDMENSNITIEPCHFDISFLTKYRENYNSYSEGK